MQADQATAGAARRATARAVTFGSVPSLMSMPRPTSSATASRMRWAAGTPTCTHSWASWHPFNLPQWQLAPRSLRGGRDFWRLNATDLLGAAQAAPQLYRWAEAKLRMDPALDAALVVLPEPDDGAEGPVSHRVARARGRPG